MRFPTSYPVAVVTGAAQGIGAALSRRFASKNYGLVLADVLVDRAEQVASEIRALGGEAMAVHVDIADETSTLEMAARAIQAFGRIDVLINNAARKSGGSKKLWEISVDEWDRLFAVNVRGVWLGIRAVLPSMREQGGGAIINMASNVVLAGNPNFLHYAASKGAVVAITRSAARELGEFNIRVNAILPGYIRTETSTGGDADDAGRALARPQVADDLAGTALFLASEASEYMTGQLLAVDGGQTFH